jgi:uncharacterized protein (TIGR03435 family)
MTLFGSPSAAQVEISRARVRERLRAAHVPQAREVVRYRRAWRTGLLVAAAAAAVVIGVAPWPRAYARKSSPVLRMLAAFTNGMRQTAATSGRPVAPDFEAVSIKPCDPDHLPPMPDNGRGGGANSVQMTPGRFRALCVTPATLIRVAFGYGPIALDFNPASDRIARSMTFGTVYGVGEEDGRRVRGGPEWMRSEKYTVEAVTSPGVTPDPLTLRGLMLQRLLERRLQLKAHIDTESVPAFALTVAKGGLKIKPVGPGACDELQAREGSAFVYGHPMNVLTPPRSVTDVRRGQKPSCGSWGGRNGPNVVVLGGDLPLEALTQSLAFRLGVRVVDRTRVTERFNFILEFALDENTQGIGSALVEPGAQLDVPAAATIFTALEEQLGLRLERAQSPREFLVIDHIERPTPN